MFSLGLVQELAAFLSKVRKDSSLIYGSGKHPNPDWAGGSNRSLGRHL